MSDVKWGNDLDTGQKIVDLTDEIWRKLDGYNPTVVVNVVGCLCALAFASYLAGPRRDQARTAVLVVADKMVPIYEQQMERVQ